MDRMMALQESSLCALCKLAIQVPTSILMAINASQTYTSLEELDYAAPKRSATTSFLDFLHYILHALRIVQPL